MPTTQQSDQQAMVKSARTQIERMIPEFAKVLPPEVTPERFARVAMTTLQTNPDIMGCNWGSVMQSITTIAQLGLVPDPVLGQAYIVPFKGRAQPIIGYKGLCELARRSGKVEFIVAEPVHEKDTFEVRYGSENKLIHRPNFTVEDRGAITHFYAIAHYKTGATQFQVMTMAEVEAIRDKSPAKNFGPWKTHFEEMGRKCPIRRLAKDLPQSVQQAVALETEYDLGRATIIQDGELHPQGQVVDVEVVAPEDQDTRSPAEKAAGIPPESRENAPGSSQEAQPTLAPAKVSKLVRKAKSLKLSDEQIETVCRENCGVASFDELPADAAVEEIMEDLMNVAKEES